jgi:SAM-dependent methyltransferase
LHVPSFGEGIDFKDQESLFRKYQQKLLRQYGSEFTGNVIEIGCERKYNHARFFPNVERFRCTNVAREYDEYLDVTRMQDVPDNSQDGYVLISVLEHVFELPTALNEIHRTLKPGGRLLVAIPYAFGHHDERDYWRLSRDAFEELFTDYEFVSFVHLGSKFSAMADELQKPRGNLKKRFLAYKVIGFGIALLGKFLETRDGFPSGYGMYALKRPERA